MIKLIENIQQLKDKISTEKVVIVDFYAKWCIPCKKISPFFETLHNNNKDEHKSFIKVDIDILSEAVELYKIEAMPTFIRFYKGKETDRVLGTEQSKLRELTTK